MPARDRLGWFHWSPKDYVSDAAVRAMNHDERGRYVDVLCALYMANTGTATEGEIRVWAAYTEADWSGHREAFARAFRIGKDAKWTQKRVAAEVRAAKNRVEKARRSGRAGARKRWPSVAMLQRSDG